MCIILRNLTTTYSLRAVGLAGALGLAVMASAPERALASLTFQLGALSNGTLPSTGANWVTLEFQDHADDSSITAGDVRLTITVANQPSGLFTNTVAFNVAPETLASSLSFTQQHGPATESIKTSTTGLSPGNGGQLGDVGVFNVVMNWGTGKNGPPLYATNGPAEFLISSSSSSLSDSSFDALSTSSNSGGSYYAVAHIQGYSVDGTTTTQSAGIVPNSGAAPEPSTLAIALSGLAVLGVARFRRRA